MARTAHGRFSVLWEIFEGETSVGADDADASVKHRIEASAKLDSGTADGQIDRVWSESADATTTPTSLDLVGSLTSRLNQSNTVSFVELTGIIVKNEGTSGNIIVGDAASNPFSGIFGADGTVVIPPGGVFCWFVEDAGIAPVAGTGDILQIVASAGTIPYKVGLMGRSA